MNYENPYSQTPFSKAVLTGLLAGLTATLLCLTYGFIYRFNTGFTMSSIINVPSIIIVCHLLMVTFGMLYYGFRQFLKNAAAIIFFIVFALVTVYCIIKAEGVERSPVHELTIQFRGLLVGMVIIIGITASFGIPFFFANKKIEEKII